MLDQSRRRRVNSNAKLRQGLVFSATRVQTRKKWRIIRSLPDMFTQNLTKAKGDVSNIWPTLLDASCFSLTWSCKSRQRDTTSSEWKF